MKTCIATEEGFACTNQLIQTVKDGNCKPYMYRSALNYYAEFVQDAWRPQSRAARREWVLRQPRRTAVVSKKLPARFDDHKVNNFDLYVQARKKIILYFKIITLIF